jgi:hypothetical protein
MKGWFLQIPSVFLSYQVRLEGILEIDMKRLFPTNQGNKLHGMAVSCQAGCLACK